MIFLLPTKSQVIHMPGLLGVGIEDCHQGGWWVGGVGVNMQALGEQV